MSTPVTMHAQTERVDVLIVTALPLEYDAVLQVSTGAVPGSQWERRMGPTGFEVAFRDFQVSRGGTLRVAVTRALEMGGVAAANAAAPLVMAYSPACLAMCGVCAGRKGEVQLGDVIIADRLWTYDTGKRVVERDSEGREHHRVQGDMFQYLLNAPWRHAAAVPFVDEDSPWLSLRPRTRESQEEWLLERILKHEDPPKHRDRKTRCARYPEILEDLWNRGWVEPGALSLTPAGRQHMERLRLLYPDGLPEPPPFRVHLGPIGTGSTVVQDPHIFDKLSEGMRKVLGLEMEASAIGAVAHQHSVPYMIVMKGVMDFADPLKGNDFKSFAARASAECLLAFLRLHPPQPLAPRVGDPGTQGEALLKPGTLRPPRTQSPAALLNARYQFVDFYTPIRSALLEDLRAWCDEREPVSVRLFHGPGGTGKTHLFIEWCQQLSHQGWRAGFLEEGTEPDAFAELVAASAARPVLAVIDYAESHQGLGALLQTVARRREASGAQGRFRLVLIAREPGDWWEDLQRRSAALKALLSDSSPAEVRSIEPTGPQREEVFWHAARCFARSLGREAPASLPLSLGDPRFGRVLYLHMAALAAVSKLPFTAETLMRDILDHEEHFWGLWAESRGQTAARDGDSRLFQRRARLAVTALTLTGGASDQEKARGLLQRACGVREELLLQLIRDLYPGARAEGGRWEVGGLEPDLLGEAMVLRTLREEGHGATAWLQRVFEGMGEQTVRTGFEVLGRLSASAPEAREWISSLLAGEVEARAGAALEAAKAVGYRTAYSALGAELAQALKREGTPQLAAKLDAAGIPFNMVSLQEVNLWVTRVQLDQLGGEGIEALAERARLKNNLGACQSSLGRREEALAAMQEAVEDYRTLAKQHPEAFLDYLAGSLTNLGGIQVALGLREAALRTVQEALLHYRTLARQHPEPWAYLPGLAWSLDSLGKTQRDLGQKTEALASAQEAVRCYRELVRLHPGEFLPGLARTLSHLSGMLSALGQREESLAAAQEAVGHYRVLAEQRPAEFLSNLAMSLTNLSAALVELGRREEVLALGHEVVGHYRALVQHHPDSFLPELASALNNLSVMQKRLAQKDEALASAQEALRHYQALAAKHPQAFLPYLARSLNTLGSAQRDLGQWVEALASFQESVRHVRALAREHPQAFLESLAGGLNNLAVLLSEVGHWDEALAAAREAVEYYRSLARQQPDAFLSQLAMSLDNLGCRQGDLKQAQAALATAQEAVGLYRALAQKHPEVFLPSLAGSLTNLGTWESDMGQKEAALASMQEAVGYYRELSRQLPEAFRDRLAGSLNNLAHAQRSLGQKEAALVSVQEAVSHYRALEEKHPEAFLPLLALSLSNLSRHQASVGQDEEALASALQALGHYRLLAKKLPKAFLPKLADLLSHLGVLQVAQGHKEEGLPLLQESVELRRTLVQQHPETFKVELVESLNNLAGAQRGMGFKEEALVTISEMVELCSALAANDSGPLLRGLSAGLCNLGMVQEELGRKEEALASYEKALDVLWPHFVQQPHAFATDLVPILHKLSGLYKDLGRSLPKPLQERLKSFMARVKP